MILVFSLLDDDATACLCARLLERGAEFLLLDPRQFRREFDLTWACGPRGLAGALQFGGQEVPLSTVRAVCVRLLYDPAQPLPGRVEGGAGASPAFEAYQALETFANTAPVLVVNRPAAGLSNGSKPYQQALIRRHGFAVPRTLVTTEPAAARRFYESCDGRVIYKSVSYVRSIVRRLGPADLDRLDMVRACPTQFQEFVPGVDVRVHTVGRRVFATEIVTDATDYRYAGREGAERGMRPVELPAAVADRCLRLAADLGLAISGVDLRRRPDGTYYCFEVNPAPGFSFYEQFTGQRIGAAIADLLCRGEV